MKKIALYCVLIMICFGAPNTAQSPKNQIIENQMQNQLGWFFGVGLGTGVQTWKIRYIGQKTGSDRFLLTNATFKIGAYQNFSEIIGLRYYYSLDVGYTQGDPASNVFDNQNIRQPGIIRPVGFFIFSQTHMFNIDLIVNAYSKENKRLDLIMGAGIGSFVPEYHTREGARRSEYSNYASSYAVDLQAHINVGAKMIFNQKYGFELMAKVPVISPTALGTSYLSVGGATISPKASEIELANYTINLSFIIEL